MAVQLQAMPLEKTQKDSICDSLSGTWYRVSTCYGFSGIVYPIYMGDTLVIERISGTDSLNWIKYKNGAPRPFKRFYVSHFDTEWEAWILIAKDGSSWSVFMDRDEFGLSELYVTDSGGDTYARKQLVSSVDNPSSTTGIQAYPNPSNGRVQLSEAFQGRVQILDATGRVLYQNHTATPIRNVDLSPYPNGIYFLRLEKQGKPVLLKVIKK